MAERVGQSWDEAIGPFVALPSPDGAGVVLFTRDTAPEGERAVELFSHDDRTTRATIRALASRRCGWVRPAMILGAVSPAIWALALSPGSATPLALEALADLAPRDSSALTVQVSRLVSALAEDSTSAPFRGLPVVVRDAWRTQLPDGTAVIVAVAMRSLNIESNPRIEIATIVAEPDGPAANAAWRTAFTRRDAGPEDRVEGADLLAAVLLGGKVPVLALLRETDRGPEVDFIERAGPAMWRVRWTTASLPCTQ